MDHAHHDTPRNDENHDQVLNLVADTVPPSALPFEHATADQLAHLIREGHDSTDLTRLILTTTDRAA